MLHAHFTAVCVRDAELLAMEFSHCAEVDLSWHAAIRRVCTCCGPFSVLWPWPWPDNLHKQTWSVLSGDTPDVQILTTYVSLSKVIVWQRDRHTESTEIINQVTSRVIKNTACMKFPTIMCLILWDAATTKCMHVARRWKCITARHVWLPGNADRRRYMSVCGLLFGVVECDR